MQASLKDGVLTITIAVEDTPRPSASGKTIVIASTHGNQSTPVLVDGKPLTIGLNAYVRA
jgi:hypothetical protein